MSLPQRLLADLASCLLDSSVVEGVACEATIKSPWIVSINQDRLPGKGSYATIRPGRVIFFDVFDEALRDAGGTPAVPAAGSCYELVSAISGSSLDISFKPPLTFVGQIADIIFLAVPIEMMAQEQMRGLRDAIHVSLREASDAKKIPAVNLRVVLMPRGVELLRIKEKTS